MGQSVIPLPWWEGRGKGDGVLPVSPLTNTAGRYGDSRDDRRDGDQLPQRSRRENVIRHQGRWRKDSRQFIDSLDGKCKLFPESY